ncbi:MAG: GIY-YIG nuclease family protein, partial [Ruminococcus sp.]|nr:GIY-YIG nuclease family protein [Ruminococcus sp.]
MSAKAKTIKMLLYDGSLSGVMNINDSAWDGGKMYSAPRESIDSLISQSDCKKYGVYLLLSDHQVYIGQASDLERRTKQHLTDKEWWT